MTRAIKPRRMWRSDMTGLLYYKALHLRAKVSPVLVIDLSPESVEALRGKVMKALADSELFNGEWSGRDADAVLAAIGIKATKSRKQK